MSDKYLFKVPIVGDGGVGKTSLRQNWFGASFSSEYMMTIGADFQVKNLDVDGKEVGMQIWDTAGQQRFTSVRSVFYKGASGILLVFDITRPSTFESIPNWIQEAMRHGRENVQLVLVGNKSDLSNIREVDQKDAQDYANDISEWHGTEVPYFETSALNGHNVDEAFETLARNMINATTTTTTPKEKKAVDAKTTLGPELLDPSEKLLYSWSGDK